MKSRGDEHARRPGMKRIAKITKTSEGYKLEIPGITAVFATLAAAKVQYVRAARGEIINTRGALRVEYAGGYEF